MDHHSARAHMAHNFTRDAAALVSALPVGSLEIPDLGMELASSDVAPIATRLVSPCARDLVPSRVLPLATTDSPLTIHFTANNSCVGTRASSVARWLSTHARLSLVVVGQDVHVSSPVSVRLCGKAWIARAIVHPSLWVDAASVTVVSISLAGLGIQPCDCLPATLRVGYNHALAPAGMVFTAARTGDIPALQAALDAGGSTEEADRVRVMVDHWKLCHMHEIISALQNGRTALSHAGYCGHIDAVHLLLLAGANPAAQDNVRMRKEINISLYVEFCVHTPKIHASQRFIMYCPPVECSVPAGRVGPAAHSSVLRQCPRRHSPSHDPGSGSLSQGQGRKLERLASESCGLPDVPLFCFCCSMARHHWTGRRDVEVLRQPRYFGQTRASQQRSQSLKWLGCHAGPLCRSRGWNGFCHGAVGERNWGRIARALCFSLRGVM